MEGKVATMAAEVQDLVTQKVSKTTKLAIEENAEVKAQFSQLSEEALVLMGENSTLRDHKSQLSVDVDILEQMLSEISRQSCIRKKVGNRQTLVIIICSQKCLSVQCFGPTEDWIDSVHGNGVINNLLNTFLTTPKCSTSSLHQAVEQLTEKYQQLQVELKDCRQELEQLQTKHTGVLTEMETLRSTLALVSIVYTLSF